jgi:hypothetical protein
VVGHLEHVGAPAVAGEEQRARGAVGAEGLCLRAQRLPQVRVGRCCIAHLEPDRLAHPHLLADRDRPRLAVRPDDRSHQEVPPVVLGPVLVDHQPDEDARRGELPLGLRQGGDHLAESLHRRLPRQLADHVRLRSGDRHLRPHRAGALGDAGEHLETSHPNGHRAVRVDVSVPQQHRTPGERGAGEAPEHGDVRSRALDRGQQLLRREAEWIAERDH